MPAGGRFASSQASIVEETSRNVCSLRPNLRKSVRKSSGEIRWLCPVSLAQGTGKSSGCPFARTDVLEHELTAWSQDARYFTVKLALFGNVHLRLNRPHAIERAIIKR